MDVWYLSVNGMDIWYLGGMVISVSCIILEICRLIKKD